MIRNARKTDIPALLALEDACFPSDGWREGSLASHLADPDAYTRVCEVNGRVVASFLGKLLPPEAEIYRVATHPDARRMGYGAALLRDFIAFCSDRGCDRLFLEVRASNAAARALYVAGGFSECGKRPRYYRHPTEDAILYTYRKGED